MSAKLVKIGGSPSVHRRIRPIIDMRQNVFRGHFDARSLTGLFARYEGVPT